VTVRALEEVGRGPQRQPPKEFDMTAMEGDLPADVTAPIQFSEFTFVVQLPQPPAASGQVYHMRAPQSAFDCAFKVIVAPDIPNFSFGHSTRSVAGTHDTAGSRSQSVWTWHPLSWT